MELETVELETVELETVELETVDGAPFFFFYRSRNVLIVMVLMGKEFEMGDVNAAYAAG